MARPLRTTFFELAEALETVGRNQEADLQYRAASSSDDSESPTPTEVLMARSRVVRSLGRHVEATRLLFEAVAAEPGTYAAQMAGLLRYVDLEFATAAADWVTTEWLPGLRASGLAASDQVDAQVVAAIVELRRDHRTQCRDLIEMASQVDPARCHDLVTSYFATENDALAAAPQGGSILLAVADIWDAIGESDRAYESVDAALSIGFSDDYVTGADAYRLRAKLRLARGDRSGAAGDYLNAGSRYGYVNDFETAVTTLERSVELDPERSVTYWYLADDIHLGSFGRPDSLASIDRALAVWEQGAGTGPVALDEAWAYLVRASLLEDRSDLQPTTGADDLWRAILDIETLLALDPTDASAWNRLNRLHRSLGNYTLAAHALQRCMELCGHLEGAAGEDARRAQIAADVMMDPERVLPNLDRLIEESSNGAPFGQGVEGYEQLARGFALLRAGEYSACIPLLESSARADPTQPIRSYLAARAYILSGKDVLGRLACGEALAAMQGQPVRLGDAQVMSGVACVAGELQRAEELVETMTLHADVSGQRPSDVYSSVLLLRLYSRELGLVEDALEALIAAGPPAGETIDIRQDLEIVARLHDDVAPIAESCIARLREYEGTVGRPSSDVVAAEEEAGRLAQKVTIDAGLAALRARTMSLLAERGDWELAAEGYLESALLDTLPSAVDAAQRLLDGALDAAEGSLRVREFADALTPAGGVQALSAPLGQLAELEARAQTGLRLLGFLDEASEPGVVAPTGRTDSVAAIDDAEQQVAAWRRSLPDVAAFWKVEGQLSHDAEGEMWRRGLWPYLASRLDMQDPQNASLNPTSTPLVLELATDLVPDDADTTWESWTLFSELIPEFKADMRATTGVAPPGVRVRPNLNFSPGGYSVLVNEVRRMSGAIAQTENSPPRDISGRQVADLRPAVDALTSVVRGEMATLFTMEQADALLQGWSVAPDVGPALSRLLPDIRSRCRFILVLRVLLAERVPLLEPKTIVDAAARVGIEADLWAVVEAIRASLDLRASIEGLSRIEVPFSLLDEIPGVPQQAPAWPASAAWELHGFVREHLPDDGSPAVLIVDDAARRPVVEFLVHQAYPDVFVLSRDEVTGRS